MDDDPRSDAFGRALRDHRRDERTEPLWQCDGAERREHPIEEFYFGAYDPTSRRGEWTASRLDGPLVDLGAGAGHDALYFQERFETVAVEASPALVDGYDPTAVDADEMLGYRRDPTPGLAGRVMWFEYAGEADPVLQFRLFSPDRLREAAIGTGWEVGDVTRREPDAAHYLAALRSR